MKRSFYLLLLLTFSFSAFGQKIKFKKRQILFDKEVAYNFDKTAGKGLVEDRAFAMTTVTGDTILTFEPVSLHFEVLPFQKEATYFDTYHLMKLHETGESIPVDYSPIGLPSRAFQYMRSTNLLTPDGLDYDQLKPFVKLMGSAQNIIDDHRQENRNRRDRYETTVAKYGEDAYVGRNDGAVVLVKDKIQINKVNIGRWAETGKKNGIGKTGKKLEFVVYMVKNMKGNNIAQLHMALAENRIIVLPEVDDERHELDFIPTVVATKTTDLLKKAAQKLVDLGYL
ncbi:hypothetical protein [Neolewinella persica]|uniref:hypothetical protein n=1 Tax=Neolewinella persica TaxID=70998 RepID=UPI00037BEE77|nr:hypothetical protein [Neolewinella persica]